MARISRHEHGRLGGGRLFFCCACGSVPVPYAHCAYAMPDNDLPSGRDQLFLAADTGMDALKVAFAIVLGIAFVVSIPREVFQRHYWHGRKRRKRLKDVSEI